MTREQFGKAYQNGHQNTVRFLLSRGVTRDIAIDVAQSAWVRGWECRHQLRDDSVLVTWVNTIALNQFRKAIRHDQRYAPLADAPYPKPALNWAALDLALILSRCSLKDRALLKAQLEGLTAKELSERTGASPTAVRLRLYRARSAARTIAQGHASRHSGEPEYASAEAA
jgi:DNA-directed RNA polymerase specialized sigma24 family protein